jgi:hypothetical protein
MRLPEELDTSDSPPKRGLTTVIFALKMKILNVEQGTPNNEGYSLIS